jgi:hypothetical protein
MTESEPPVITLQAGYFVATPAHFWRSRLSAIRDPQS